MWKVLIADDEPKIRQGLKSVLEEMELSITVCAEARNGMDALEKVGRFQPDFCLVDICMPKLSGIQFLEELRKIDPTAAEKLHLRDEKRIIRALEVWQETGRTITEHDALERQRPPKYDALYIGLDFEDRQDLRDRIDRRVDAMVAQGLLAEVEALLSGGLPRDATALQAIGYKQFLAVAEGTATTEEAIAEVKLRSRQYAKRQLTWLRRNPDIFWVRWQRDPNFPEGLQKATEYLHSRGLC